jgi:hypothetical protein
MRTKMLKGLSAILLAGVSAGFIVGFVTEPERAAAAATPAAKPHAERNSALVNRAVLVAATATCAQTWPYYEQSCLRDNRRAGDAGPAARVISLSHPATAPVKAQVPPVKAPVSKVAKLAGGTR